MEPEPPRIPEDPEQYGLKLFPGSCPACACWRDNNGGEPICPRRAPRNGEESWDPGTFLCWGANRPDGIRVMYVARRLYGNEED